MEADKRMSARFAVDELDLAAEGYRFYAQEASEFAGASVQAFAETLGCSCETGPILEIGPVWLDYNERAVRKVATNGENAND